MGNIFTKVKDYFTANSCRKIFFFGLVFGLMIFIIDIFMALEALRIFGVLCFLVAVVSTLVDTMYARAAFLRKVREMQYDHLQAIYDQQQAGKDVPITPTFTDTEKKYIKRKKWAYVGTILVKLTFAICLFSLLLSQ